MCICGSDLLVCFPKGCFCIVVHFDCFPLDTVGKRCETTLKQASARNMCTHSEKICKVECLWKLYYSATKRFTLHVLPLAQKTDQSFTKCSIVPATKAAWVAAWHNDTQPQDRYMCIDEMRCQNTTPNICVETRRERHMHQMYWKCRNPKHALKSRARKPWSANCELKHWSFRGWKCLIYGLHFTV